MISGTATIRDELPFEILVEVIAAHDGQSLEGTPESHIVGRWKSSPQRAFPIIEDPTLTPGFVQYIATDAEKAELLHKFQADVLNLSVARPENGKWR